MFNNSECTCQETAEYMQKYQYRKTNAGKIKIFWSQPKTSAERNSNYNFKQKMDLLRLSQLSVQKRQKNNSHTVQK